MCGSLPMGRVHGRTLMCSFSLRIVRILRCRVKSTSSQTCAYLKSSTVLLNFNVASRSLVLLVTVARYRNTSAILEQSSQPFPERGTSSPADTRTDRLNAVNVGSDREWSGSK